MLNNLLKENYHTRPNKNYIYEKISSVYKPITYKDFIEKVNYLAHYLLDNNLKDKKILVFSNNSINYMIADLAILSYVGIVVNIAKDTKEKELEEIIKNIEISCIIYGKEQEKIITNIKNKNQQLLTISMSNDFPIIFEKYMTKNIELFNFPKKDENQCSKIVFSSGTSANPKAIMLSIKNIFAGWESLQRRTKFTAEDICYLFLPLHHTYANIYNFIYSLLSGLTIYLSSGIENIEEELLEVNPTIFCGVPLIFKKIYYDNQENLTKAFGTKIKYIYSGGSYFDKELRKIYKDNNLPLIEAYALTETSSSLSIEYPNKDDYSSVGTIFEDIFVKIENPTAEGIGEIAVKGDNVFLGYYKNDQLTKKSFTKDKYFLTGDLGYIKDKKLYLIGRKKKLLLGDNGENIYPEEIEKLLKSKSPNINHVKVYLNDNKLAVTIFVKKEEDIDSIIKNYNQEVTKKDIIKEYQVIVDSIETRLKG